MVAFAAACGGTLPQSLSPQGEPTDASTPAKPVHEVEDAGSAADAGAPPTVVVDAGVAVPDAGLPVDAGPVPMPDPTPDAGAPAVDAGTPTVDAGTPAVDAGSPEDAGTPPAGPPDAGAPPPPPAGPHIGGCPSFPANHPLNRDISGDAVDARSAAWLATLGSSSLSLHPDFGAPQYGLPYTTVPASQSRVAMSFAYAAESDPGPYPYPPDLFIQGGPNGSGDRHAIVLDRDRCLLYETFDTRPSGGGFSAGSGAVFDLNTGASRPVGWTSATASGLPLLPALARPEEVLDEGEIRHALLFTAGWTAHSYVAPASHSSGTSSDPNAPPMGIRVRLKASFDTSHYKGTSLIILRALQRYGMVLVDNSPPGYFWSVAGAQSTRWVDSDLQPLKSVPADAFEAVAAGQVHAGQ